MSIEAVSLPPGHDIRPPVPNDLDAVANLLIADQLASGGQSTLGADYIRRVWTGRGFDLATDAWVITDRSRRIVAYGQVTHGTPGIAESWGVVDPACRGRGIGSFLFARIEEHASLVVAGRPSARFRHAVDATDAGAAAILEAQHLRPVRHFWHRQRDLAEPIEPGSSPRDIEFSQVDDERLPAVHAVLQAGFAADWGHHPQAFEAWAQERANNPGYDLSLWLLARAGKEPVGALIARAVTDGGWVDEIAVLPQHRGRGIGGALLQRSFAALQRRGLQRVMLNVDAENPTGATELYERVGMRVVDRWDLWERSLVADRG